MKTLNHPLKRLSFLLFVLGTVVLGALALLPTPLHVSSSDEWRDSVGSESVDRRITRVDSACAAKDIGNSEAFAKDFLILDAYAAENEYTRVIAQDAIERAQRFSLAKTFDLTDEEKASFLLHLSKPQKLCLGNACVQKLTSSIFTSVLASCSKSVGQHRHEIRDLNWRIGENLSGFAPWPLVALTFSLLFLLTSLLYDKTLGRLINWIRTGS